jgi:hypothetical protein
MSYLAPGKQALRATSSALRAARVAGKANTISRNARLIHESAKASAVHATTQSTMGHSMSAELMPNTSASAVNTASRMTGRVAVPKGQLNIQDNLHKPEFYKAVSKIMAIRADYLKNRWVWIPANEMEEIVLGLGATKEDLALLPDVGDSLTLDPTLPFRKSVNGRFLFDYEKDTVQRLEFQPFALSVEEDFDRYDSGVLRRFNELDNNIQLNTVMQALFVFKSMIIHGMKIAHRPKMDYSTEKNIMTLFAVRTTTNEAILGHPALEGIHSDGVDHTMTTLLHHRNMRSDSAATFMHAMHETTGVDLNEAKPENIRARVQHTKFLDTLMLVDHENKHSLSPVYQEDMSQEAIRDMLILFTRKPCDKDHISGKIDSQVPHRDLPMEIPLFVPRTE